MTQGVTVAPTSDPKKRPIQYFYDVENDRECRQVRERQTELDLSIATIIPAASNSKIWSSSLSTPGYPPLPPTSQLPHIVFANGQSLSGAQDILDYLDTKYPSDKVATDSNAPLTTVEMVLQDVGS